MKTTIELPDQLFVAAKAVAAQRRTTLKAMLEHALRREIGFDELPSADKVVEMNRYGFPVLKKHGTSLVTSEQIYALLDEENV